MKLGQQQQRYRVLERLAAGGMAEVYLAESAGIEGFKKRVAIKRVLPHLSEKKRFIAMFLDEARLSANLTHSNVAQVFDIGVGESAYFIVMEYVDGSDLKAIIDFLRKTKRPLPVEVAVYIGEKICEGLAYAHEARGPDGTPLHVVHRDVTPANVLITKWGEVKIVDFGLAKATSQLEKSEPGIVKGKFGYLSPEATRAEEVDARTDIFAVGIILWELLAGKRLFLGGSDYQTIKRVQEALVPSLTSLNKDVPPELEKIIARALAKEPEKRFQTAREFGRALTSLLFKMGRPVGAHDVAELVHGTVALRKTSDQDKDTALHKLIEAALLEFTSLHDSATSGRSGSIPDDGRGALPRAPKELPERVSQFEDIGKWAEEVETNPMSGEMRSSRAPGSRRIQLITRDVPVDSAAAVTVKTRQAADAEVDSVPVTRKDVPLARAVADEVGASGPAGEAKESPQTFWGVESAPVPTLKEVPLAKEPVESAPATTAKATPDAKTTARSPGARGPEDVGEDRPAPITVLGSGDEALTKPAQDQKKTLMLVAAVLVLVVLAYLAGLASS
ncbi:serine/threonine protein kinase [Polyangium aurulentum]|uniref:serine/threonine protein kinase n=1 Tax=Polyangium aurulentum TaxID=2567896 RepID=UPI0010AE8E1B|nr:serine/threonine-protein kinase [Polyangium aurulentum]UQA55864.1 protein kinase [Polyangium aurulentum]